MVIRPVDSGGDVLPVLSSAVLLRDASAVAELINDRLKLLVGDWWENLSWGNAIVEMLRETRYTEADQQTLATDLSSYIRETEGVLDVRDLIYSVDGRTFHFSCTVETENGTAEIDYEV